MYADYFGLKELPFSIAPNPRFLYMSNAHQEALAHLVYGLESTGGFIVLTGEVGTGKTTLCRKALERSPEDIRTAFIITSNLAPEQLLEAICDELSINYKEGASIRKLTDLIHHDLIKSHGEGMQTVLIIDEAQNMQRDTLEQIRMLTNLETNEEKLLRIILIGQPELTKLLRQEDMRQLRQRITGAYHLDQLDETNTRSYIESRLNTAGAARPIFDSKAFKQIYKLSHGIPRVVNVICDRALLGAFSHGDNLVTAKHVNQAFVELDTLENTPKKAGFSRLVAILASILLIGALGMYALKLWNENRTPNTAGHNQTIHNIETIKNEELLSLRDAFSYLTRNNLGTEAANCSSIVPIGYQCESFKEATIADLHKFQDSILVETQDDENHGYWLLHNIDEDTVTLSNGVNHFTITVSQFSSSWTGTLLALNPIK